MKLVPNSHEFWIALETFAADCGMRRRNDFRVGDLWLMSVGRIYLRDWGRRDAEDPEYYDGKSTSGWRDGDVAESDDRLRRKWADRSRIYVSDHADALYLIGDWLYGAAEEHADWLRNIDEKGRPRKLMKCGTIAQLLHEAWKWHRRREQQQQSTSSSSQLGLDDEHFVQCLRAGHTLVRLMSPRALDRESEHMRHCIGWGGYDTKVNQANDYRYFSVRDEDGKPVATIEAQHLSSQWVVTQFFAAHNVEPSPDIRDLFEGAMSLVTSSTAPRSPMTSTVICRR